MKIERTCFIPGDADRAILGSDPARGWSAVDSSCPPELRARIVEFRQRTIQGLETRSLFSSPIYPSTARRVVAPRHEVRHRNDGYFLDDDGTPLAEKAWQQFVAEQEEQRRRRQQLLNSLLS